MAVVSQCIEKITCPDCSVKPNTHLQTYVNTDKDLDLVYYTSFCHGECWEVKGDPYVGKETKRIKKPKSLKEVKEELDTVKGCKPFKPLEKYRGIPPNFFVNWGCKLIFSTITGKPSSIGFKYLIGSNVSGYKVRPFINKKFFAIGRTSGSDLFNYKRAVALGNKVLYMVEGEFDAIALDYIAQKFARKKLSIVSLTNGGGSFVKDINNVDLKMFKELRVMFDDDKVGIIARDYALDMESHKVTVIDKIKDCKDANDVLVEGKGKLLSKQLYNY